MAQKWTNDELELLSSFDAETKPVDVFQAYKGMFGENRSYDSVQKKFRSLFKDDVPAETEESSEEDMFLSWEEMIADQGIKPEKYRFDPVADEYIIHTKKGMLPISGRRIRELLEMYSNYGAKKTINQVAQEFGWARHAVIDVLRALGKTHDSSPYTDETLAEVEAPDLVKDIVRKKEQKVLAAADRKIQKKNADDASKWRNVEKAIEEVFENHEYDIQARDEHFCLIKPDKSFDVTLYHTDAHVGKMAQHWGYEEARRIILGTAERALQNCTKYGRPDRIITGIGGDWCNIDTPGSTTTRGTPQFSPKEWYKIMSDANQIALDLLLLMSEVAPVEALTIPGNHDRMWSMMAGDWLHKMFENNDRINVQKHQSRHYVQAGKNMLMFTHGDGAKPKDYPSIMSAEAAKMWGNTEYRYAYHGHLHHEKVKEHPGVTVTQMPSISPEDDWHIHEGFVGTKRALCAYVHDHEAGRTAQFTISIDEEGNIFG